MAITKVSRGLLSTGISDSSDATAITITSDEKVGIGTTSPSYMLTVKSSTENHLRLENGSELGVFILNSDGDIKIWAHGADERINFLNGAGSGTNIAAFDSDGLKFGSDTATTNGLNDYEQGSWTPVAGGVTTQVVRAYYTKIGNLVYAQFYVLFTPANNTNQFQITGLPYTATRGYAGGSLGYTAGFNTNEFHSPIISDSTSYVYFHKNNGNTASVTNADLYAKTTGTFYLLGTVTYQHG